MMLSNVGISLNFSGLHAILDSSPLFPISHLYQVTLVHEVAACSFGSPLESTLYTSASLPLHSSPCHSAHATHFHGRRRSNPPLVLSLQCERFLEIACSFLTVRSRSVYLMMCFSPGLPIHCSRSYHIIIYSTSWMHIKAVFLSRCERNSSLPVTFLMHVDHSEHICHLS